MSVRGGTAAPNDTNESHPMLPPPSYNGIASDAGGAMSTIGGGIGGAQTT